MKKRLLTLWLATAVVLLWAQDAPIKLYNPSFEGPPANSSPPVGWDDCGFAGESPPDTQAGDGTIFKVNQKAQAGRTFLGMVARDNDTWEAVSQQLTSPLLKGQCYSFSLWLSRSKRYYSLRKSGLDTVEYTTPVKIRVWGGIRGCDKRELLAESTLIDHSEWKRYDFKLKPTQNLGMIMIEAFYKTPSLNAYNGNILIDNASDIIPIPCDQLASSVQPKLPPTAKPPAPKPPVTKPPVKPAPVAKAEPKPTIMTELDRNKLKTGQIVSIKSLNFDADSSSLKKESFPALDEIYRFLSSNKDVFVEIGGHTNNKPTDEFCDRLSTARARSVAEYLISKGIPTERVKYKGYGKRMPIADNNTAEGRLKNQRVEIKILSMNG
jgi:outer membrane protein OmpA-like peptidoglycan-associated protein